MKTLIFSIIALLMAGCATTSRIRTVRKAAVNVVDARESLTDAQRHEWYSINAQVFRKAHDGAATFTGSRVYLRLAEFFEEGAAKYAPEME